MIAVSNLTKHYSMGATVVVALREVTFEIADGGYVAIMGPSGSGKTTLLDILGCLSQPTSGEYRLGGREVSGLKEQELADLRNREIGFVFQNFNLLARATAQGNVELPLLYNGVAKKERARRAVAALDDVGLGDRVHHRPSELSGGQRQRVAIARALVNEPSIIFADEPTGNLDSKNGEAILEIFADLNRQGHTIVMVTHERKVAEHTERILSFRDGELVQDERWNEEEKIWRSASLAGS